MFLGLRGLDKIILQALAFAVSSGAGRLEARRKLGQLFPHLKGFSWATWMKGRLFESQLSELLGRNVGLVGVGFCMICNNKGLVVMLYQTYQTNF